MGSRAERAARNEAVFREVNEHIEDANRRFGAFNGTFLCECSRAGCTQSFPMSVVEYEQVRSRGDQFALVDGHEDPEVERVIDRTDRFVLVQKLGAGAELAERLDPRGDRAA